MKEWKFKAQMNTKYGIGCEGIKATTLAEAHEKAVKKHGYKLIMTWDTETGDELFKNNDEYAEL